MIREHDEVALVRDLPENGLERGDLGTVVHLYRDGEAYEVEFMTMDGGTIAVLTLKAEEVRSVGRGEIAHVRELATA